tara:strand:- start:6542 stop:6706 length:165 start_codon:yes stop_codon:yes gene_type:complete
MSSFSGIASTFVGGMSEKEAIHRSARKYICGQEPNKLAAIETLIKLVFLTKLAI